MIEARTIRLPWPSGKLTPHAKGHWRPKAEATAKARAMAKVVCMEKPRIETIPNACIFVEYYPKTYRGDVHNMHGRMKAYIDGIADAMGCDDRDFRVDFPTVWAGKSKAGEVVFRILPPVVDVQIIGEINANEVPQ